MMVMILTVSLATGLALGDGAYATTSTSSPFANTRSSYQHNSRFDGNLIVHGVDVSYFQSAASNWYKAKKDGCDYSIMRVTYTTYGSGSLNIDSKFATHFKKAKAAGVMKGVYVFSQAKNATEAKKEARYAVKRLKALGIGPEDLELPVYMDYEFAGGRGGRLNGLTRTNAIKAVNAYAAVIRSYGYDPGVYANTNFFRSYLGNGAKLASDIDQWCAQYYYRNESSCNYTKWQYTSTSKVNGVLYYSTNKVGSCDADFWYLKRSVNKSPKTTIYGNTYLKYTGKAVLPTLSVYYGSTKLKEGKDYIVGGIKNVNHSAYGSYAYVKGIGKYGGYALVPIKISSGYIKHPGLSPVGGVIFTKKSGASYKIGTDAAGAYVRNVPANTTVKTLLANLKLKSGYSGYKLAVVNARGQKVKKSAKVVTGLMVGVYKGSTLKGTADITVNGSTINNTGANYLKKVNRSSVTYTTATASATTSTSATTSNGDLVVDGQGGSATIKRLQKMLGVKQTGSVTIKKALQKYSPSVKSVKNGTKDTNTVTALQKWLGISADGEWGRNTSKALQKKVGASIDGYFGTNSMKALQRFLNKQ